MSDWIWITPELAEAIHDRQLAEHGGPGGVRDRGLLDSALARPQQLAAYGGLEVDAPALAAAYAFGMARNHPFVDGNKRTAYVLCRTFLVLNGWDMLGDLAERYPVFLGLAEGSVGEDELAAWLRRHCRPAQVSEASASYR
ncbi:MAG: type II toxin-antitoxin system death-on-curing family toxin [Wenzhouxiangella sp.]